MINVPLNFRKALLTIILQLLVFTYKWFVAGIFHLWESITKWQENNDNIFNKMHNINLPFPIFIKSC